MNILKQLFCKHKYEHKIGYCGFQTFYFRECKICGKVKG